MAAQAVPTGYHTVTPYLVVDDVVRLIGFLAAAFGGLVQERQEMPDEFYGDRTAAVKGPCGNLWWLATHIEDVSSEEIARRMQVAGGGPHG